MQDLRKQLLNAGLIDKRAKKHADKQARTEKKRKGAVASAEEESLRKERFEQQLEEKRSEDRRREKQRKAERAANEERFRLRDIVRQGTVYEGRRGRRRFYFVTRAGRIPFIEIADELALQLEMGRVAIVEVPLSKGDDYEIVDRGAAEKVAAVDGEMVRFWNR